MKWNAPPINDIATLLSDPPYFFGPAPRRTHDPVLPERFATLIAQQYDLAPLRRKGNAPDVFETVVGLVKELGWQILHLSPANRQVEAVAITSLLRFRDDIAVRVRQDGDEVVVDVRSRSRLGIGDMGVNAARIVDLLARLGARWPGVEVRKAS